MPGKVGLIVIKERYYCKAVEGVIFDGNSLSHCEVGGQVEMVVRCTIGDFGATITLAIEPQDDRDSGLQFTADADELIKWLSGYYAGKGWLDVRSTD
jgi:hypothetical protein